MSKNYCQKMTFLLSEGSLENLKILLSDESINGLVLALAVDDDTKLCITIAPSSYSEVETDGTTQKILRYEEIKDMEATPYPPGGHKIKTSEESGKKFTVITVNKETN